MKRGLVILGLAASVIVIALAAVAYDRDRMICDALLRDNRMAVYAYGDDNEGLRTNIRRFCSFGVGPQQLRLLPS